MEKNLYGIEMIITILSLRDVKATKVKGRRVRHYVLSRETETAVDIKRKYMKGKITEKEYVAWVYNWLDHNEVSQEEWDYLDKSPYVSWLKKICTSGDK